MPQLNVGDVIYETSHYKEVTDKKEIDRVTPKMAYCGNLRFSREYGDDFRPRQFDRRIWDISYWLVEHPEIKGRYEMCEIKKHIKALNLNSISNDKLRQAYDILTSKPE